MRVFFFLRFSNTGTQWRINVSLSLHLRSIYVLWKLNYNKWKLIMSSNYPFLAVLMLSPASRPGLLGTAVAPALIGCNECVSCALPWSLLLCSQICPSVCSQLLFCFSFPVVQPEGLYLKVATMLFLLLSSKIVSHITMFIKYLGLWQHATQQVLLCHYCYSLLNQIMSLLSVQ